MSGPELTWKFPENRSTPTKNNNEGKMEGHNTEMARTEKERRDEMYQLAIHSSSRLDITMFEVRFMLVEML